MREVLPISIHALREESDRHGLQGLAEGQRFQSTPSARRATRERLCLVLILLISIHALREEGDETASAP